MASRTTWHPDTCDCVIAYDVDDTAPDDVRFGASLRCCPAHASLVGPAHLNTVIEENRRKNDALTIAQRVSPAIRPEDYQWEFDAQRRLRVRFPGLAPGLRAAVQAALDTKLGPGLATVT